MSGFLKTWTWARAPQKQDAWGLDRNWHRSEAARHLKSGNLADAERHLTIAVREADERGLAPAQRVSLRLDLADLQRKLAAPSGIEAGIEEGTAQLDVAKLQDAENTLREAIIVCTQASDAKLYLRSLDALADIFCLVEDYAALETVVFDAIRLGAATPGENIEKLEERLRRLAMAQDRNGRFPDALKTFEQAVSLREKHYGAGHVETGNLLAEVGRICRARGFQDQAQGYLKRALRIHEEQFGEDSVQALDDVQQLAGTLEDLGDLDGAAAQYERTLGLKLRQLGRGNLEEVAEMQYSLACLHIGWGHYSRARELLMECVGTFKRAGGSRLAMAYESLAHVEEREGRMSFALDEMEKAARIWEKCNPPQLEDLARNLELRAELSDHLRLRVEANLLRKQARHISAAAQDQAADTGPAQTA
ncbi:MAG TPA: tetratricopeptide repeat protein [Bryobacteraceae bacterium]|jgi:tetratricopeptide (TPR) repeat protein|nr:tetratricopeptide repeat protein [Bryobacteraceae bacterium]